jgi:GNAT superfamily N-acetyltransferase
MLLSSKYDVFTEGVRMVSDTQIAWWAKSFAPVSMMPKTICDRLVDGLPGDRERHVSYLDPYTERTDVIVTGTDSQGQVFEAGRSFHFKSRCLNLDMASVRSDVQRLGYGRALARNSYRLASALGFDRITLTALQVGAYSWARLGFMPTYESWNNDNCRRKVRSQLGKFRDQLDPNVYADALSYVDWREPEAIWLIADLDMEVIVDTPPRYLPLGFALLYGGDASWFGSIELRHCEVRTKQIERVRDYLGLDATE